MNDHTNWPEGSNLFGTIQTEKSKSDIAAMFSARGWTSRKCTWVDFEVACEWAEIVIEGEYPILIHGSVVNVEENWRPIATILKENNVGFSLECYDENKNLIHEEQYAPT